VYNGERFLRDAVESVLTQSLSDFEFVVVDDGSTDATGAILAEYASGDARIVVHRQANVGGTEARNRGFRLASAPLVANMDADDIALPTRLEKQVELMTQRLDVGVVGGAVAFMNASGREFGEWQYPLGDAEIRKAFAHTTPLAHPATMVRKDAFFAVGGYRALFSVAQDIDLWLRIADSHELANLSDVTIRYRIHPEQATVRKCEVGALGALAARIAARARAEGRPDPVDTIDRIDGETLRRIGATDHEIASAVIGKMTWVAKTIGRAGYLADSERLFRDAQRRAEQESPDLAAHVHRQHARLHREQGRRVSFALEAVRAARAEFAATRRR
jgi:glycosyltransferase involved in cell wall biosynthesis